MESKSMHYDIMKVIATFFVVFAHSSRMYTGEGVVIPLNSSLFLCQLTKLIYDFHMPLYLGISGMVYGFCINDLNKYNDSIKFIKNKFVRLIVPYLFFGLIYVAPIMILLHFTNNSYIEYCISGILMVKDSRHLWYIVVLFEIYIICMVSKKIMKKGSCFLDMFILLGVSYFSYIFPGIFQISNLAYYFIFFYLGVLFNKYYQKIMIILKNPVIIFLMLIFQMLLFNYSNWIINFLKAIFGSLFIVGISKYIPEKILSQRFFFNAKINGFGIYLFHPMIIYILYFFLGSTNTNPIILCLGIAIISYILSWLFTELFRKLKLSILIGE